VTSPGVRRDAPCLQAAAEKSIPVVGEMELATSFCPCPIIAVTGSNGKTTVVTLITEVIRQDGRAAHSCGNIGYPLADQVLQISHDDYVVMEVSSFQLETICSFKPFIAVWLNFSQNHLDRHRDLEEYFLTKKRIFENQTADDFAVLNQDDDRIKSIAVELKSQVFFFSPREGGKEEGALGNANFLAVTKVAAILGISLEVCERVFTHLKGAEHRLEKVCTLHEVDYINDSKSTTGESGRWALNNILQPVIMICGGRDKNIDFSSLRDIVGQKVKKMIVIGEAGTKLKNTFQSVVDVRECAGLAEAVALAQDSAQAGDCVLLSPLCASFDMFQNYEERGRVFKEYVRQLR